MSREKCNPQKIFLPNKIKEEDNPAYVYNYPDEEVKINLDKYNRCCGINVRSWVPMDHFPKMLLDRKIRFHYNEKGYLTKILDMRKEYNEIASRIETAYFYDSYDSLEKIQRSYFEENNEIYVETREYQNIYHTDGTLEKINTIYPKGNICKANISYLDGEKTTCVWDENSEIKYKIISSTDGTLEKMDFYLPNGELSYSLMKKRAYDGTVLCERINPMKGKYIWKLLNQKQDSYEIDGKVIPIMQFEIKLYEPVFTSEMFLELLQFALEKSDTEISLHISGDWYCVPQKEAEQIYEMSLQYSVDYKFIV